MTELELQEELVRVLLEDKMELASDVETFEEAGLLTRNKGVVIWINGQQFQLTIKKA